MANQKCVVIAEFFRTVWNNIINIELMHILKERYIKSRMTKSGRSVETIRKIHKFTAVFKEYLRTKKKGKDIENK